MHGVRPAASYAQEYLRPGQWLNGLKCISPRAPPLRRDASTLFPVRWRTQASNSRDLAAVAEGEAPCVE